MQSTTFHSQVYMKILEGRNIIKEGSSKPPDPLVEIAVDGVKRDKLTTSVCDKTTTPEWHQEFVFSIPRASAMVELKVYDHNMILSNTLLGTAMVTISHEFVDCVHDMWLEVKPHGSLHVLISVTPFVTAPVNAKGALNVRLPQLRMQLEQDAYYPGQIIRGAAVHGLNSNQSGRTFRALRLEVDGRCITHWATGGKHKTHYYAVYVYFNNTSLMLGSFDKKIMSTMREGSYVFPFEYVLPMDIPCSFRNEPPKTPFIYDSNYNRFTVRAYLDMGRFLTASDTVSTFYVTVLPSPHHQIRASPMASISSKATGIFTADQAITCHVSGAPQMFRGEPYALQCTLHNYGTKPIEYLLITLRHYIWCHGKISGNGDWRKIEIGAHIKPFTTWRLATLPGFPIAPGSSWNGVVMIDTPSDALFSTHCHWSPLIQISHFLKVQFATQGNIFTKATGETKLPVVVLAGAQEYPHLPTPPVEAMGPIGFLTSAPADPLRVYPLLIPSPTPDGTTVPCSGKLFGEISTYPGAFVPPQEIWKVETGDSKDFAHALITEKDWRPGTQPSWVKEDDGVKPEQDLDLDLGLREELTDWEFVEK